MTHNATEILDQAERENERIYDHVRDVAGWFHDHEGEMFERSEARNLLADDLNIDEDIAQSLIAELVGDDVDPITQARVKGTKYVGVAEFHELEGAYGYLDYHDLHGKRKRVICAQCVHEATYDTEVAHATAGDPDGSYSPNATYSKLLSGVHKHYENSHEEKPENVKTGASLVSGTTIGGNTSWHAGNDGSGTGLDADTVDGNHAGEIFSMRSYTDQTSNRSSGTTYSTGDKVRAVSAWTGTTDGGSGGQTCTIDLYVDGTPVARDGDANNDADGGGGEAPIGPIGLYALIPPNSSYYIDVSGLSINKWLEADF